MASEVGRRLRPCKDGDGQNGCSGYDRGQGIMGVVMRAFALAAMMAFSAVPAAAQKVPDFASMSDKELQAEIGRSGGDVSDACNRSVPMWQEAAKRFASADLSLPHTLASVFCAMQQGEYARGATLLRPVQASTGEFGALALALAVWAEDAPDTLAQLQSLAAKGELGSIEDDQIFAATRLISRNDMGEGLRQLATGVVGTPAFATLDPAVRSMFAYQALRDALARQETADVEALLPHIQSPPTWRDMLAMREFESIWPMLEQHAGPHLETISEGYVRYAAARLAEQPGDGDRASAHTHALLYAGRWEEAIAAARPWNPTGKAPQEGAGWAKNVEAYALDALGRTTEADAVFDGLAKLDADAHPWVVNFVINRASRLVGQGRWAEGLAATELARAAAERHGTPYARMIIARDRTCALQQLGRAGEIQPELAYLRENQAEAPDMVVTALLCGGMREEAVVLLRQQLGEEMTRNMLMDDMQDARFELFYTPSQLPLARDLILAEPELSAIALSHVRILPDELVPVAWLRRVAAGPAAQ